MSELNHAASVFSVGKMYRTPLPRLPEALVAELSGLVAARSERRSEVLFQVVRVAGIR